MVLRTAERECFIRIWLTSERRRHPKLEHMEESGILEKHFADCESMEATKRVDLLVQPCYGWYWKQTMHRNINTKLSKIKI